MNRPDIVVPGKVGSVESQEVTDAVDSHRRHQARIMDLHTRDAMSNYQAAPLGVDPFVIRKQGKLAFD